MLPSSRTPSTRLLVVAMRADRMGDVSSHPEFARLVERSLHLLGAMDDSELRAAIEGPAHQAGLLLEPGLVDLLVRDVEREPGALPLLSHALRSAWERREGQTLTVAGYRETGGIRGAVAQSAEEIYEQTPAEQRRILRDLLLRLVAPSAEGEPVPARVPRRLLATDQEHERLIELLVAARLVTSDDGTVELAHEALARAWPRLRGWLDDDVEGQRILRHLAMAADTWDAMARPDSELYRGVRLAQALDWRDQAHPDLTPTEQTFLDTSRNVAEAERQTAEARAQHQARVNRRLRTLLTCVALLLVVALVAGGIALDQRGDARDAGTRRRCRSPRDAGRRAAARTAEPGAPPGARGAPPRPVGRHRRRVWTALATVPPGIERLLPVDGLNGVAAVSPDQRLFAAPVDDGDVRIVDFATGRTLRTLQGGGAGLLNVTAFSPDGGLLVSGGRDGLIRLWDGRTGRSVGAPFRAGSGAVWGAFDPTDSTTLFTVSPRSVLRWDVSRPDHPVRVGAAFGFPDEPLEAVSMRTSPDGRLVAVGGLTGGRAVVWDVDAGMRVAEYEGLPGVFTADGSTLVVVRRDHLAFIDLATGAEQGERITGFTTVAPGLVMSPTDSGWRSPTSPTAVSVSSTWSPVSRWARRSGCSRGSPPRQRFSIATASWSPAAGRNTQPCGASPSASRAGHRPPSWTQRQSRRAVHAERQRGHHHRY